MAELNDDMQLDDLAKNLDSLSNERNEKKRPKTVVLSPKSAGHALRAYGSEEHEDSSKP